MIAMVEDCQVGGVVALSMQHESLRYLTNQSAKSNKSVRIEWTLVHAYGAEKCRQNFQKKVKTVLREGG